MATIPRIQVVCSVCKSVTTVPLAYVKEGLPLHLAERAGVFKMPVGWAMVQRPEGLRLVCNSTCATSVD